MGCDMTAFNFRNRMTQLRPGARTAIAATALGLFALAAAVGGTAVPPANAASARPSSLHLINSTPRAIHVTAVGKVGGCIRTPNLTGQKIKWKLHPNSPGPAFNVEHANTPYNQNIPCTKPGKFYLLFWSKNPDGEGNFEFTVTITVGIQGRLNGLNAPDKPGLTSAAYRVRTACFGECKIGGVDLFKGGYSTEMYLVRLAGRFDGQYFRYTLTVSSLR